MSGMNKSAYRGKRMGLLTMAIALMTGAATLSSEATTKQNMSAGNSMFAAVRYHHRTITTHRTGSTAAQKRASTKRRNIAKRNRTATHRQPKWQTRAKGRGNSKR